VRSWLVASVVAMLLLVLFAAPISAAAAGAPRLTGAVVTPRTGTPSTTIVITVTYSSDKGFAAESVTARVGTVDKTMTRLPGGDWRKGVAYRWSGKLPIGSYSVVISARSTHKGEVSAGAGTVKIAAKPKPTPTPEPKATPRPTPTPTARPIVRPTSPPTIGSLAAPTATPEPTATPNALPLIAMLVATNGPGGGPTGGPTGGPSGPTPPSSNSTAGPRGGPANPSRGSGPLASLLAIAGFQGGIFTGFPLVPTLVTTTGAVAMGMAFGLFGRRRREDEDDDALSAAAANGVGFVQHDGAVAVGAANGIAAASGAVLDLDDTEALMPRWRRPSLIQARKADPIRDMAPAPRLTFDQGLVGPLDDGRERKVVRYRVVRLLDSPDELRGQEIGYLDQGDEVQLLEKYGAYWLVLSPDGQQGWLHKMTLGDVYEDDAPAPEGPVATMPIAAETWTMGEADIDGDVFDAYLESRRRRGD
jgi:hypothetical protein